MQTQLEHKAFLLLLALVTVAFCWLLMPFYGAVFWAVILAIVFQPLQRVFERRFGMRSNLAAALSVLVCIVIAIIPMALILGALVSEGAASGAGPERRLRHLDLVQRRPGALPDWAQHWLDRLGIGNLEAMRGRLVVAARSRSAS